MVNTGGDQEVFLRTYRKGGTLDATISNDAHTGRRALLLISKGSPHRLCFVRAVSPGATTLSFWLKTSSTGTTLVLHISSRYGSLRELRIPLEACDWRRVELPLYPDAGDVLLALVGLSLRGKTTVLLNDSTELVRSNFALSFFAGFPG